MRERVDERKVGDTDGPPGLGINGNQHRNSASEPACEPSSLGWTPKAAAGPEGRESEAKVERGRASEPAPRATTEEAGHHPMDLDSSAETPDPPPLSIQEPYSPALYEKIGAPSQAPRMNAGCSDHLSYDQLRDL